ncbi:MAG: segregation/condensation protein A [Bacillota bacterium]|nr:segregation/condensation protein A [Bacillota bacterium]
MPEQAEYKIKLPVFEGPFDLLFHLIKKAEVDIWSISIAEITDQYLAYLQSMKELNLDIASEFLVMAATLLRLKSKLLLPRPVTLESEEEDEEFFHINTAEELFLRLEEYRFFKEVSSLLQLKEEEQQKIYLRSTGGRKMMVISSQESVYTIWEGANHLSEIMHRFAAVTMHDSYRTAFNALEDFVVTEKSAYIESILWKAKRALPMKKFIGGEKLWDLIVTFVALLEMARRHRVILLQERPFGEILVALRNEEEMEKGVDDEQRTAEENC